MEQPITEQPTTARGMGLFTLIWAGQVVSTVGTALTSFALGVQVFQDTGSVTRFALIGLSMALPNLLLSPLAGVLADAWDRRVVLIVAHAGSALCTLALYALVSAGRVETWHVYPTVAASAAFSTLVWPTFAAATTLIVGKENLSRASGMTQMGTALSQIVAPVLAAALLVSLGLRAVILIDFATFLFAVVVLLSVRFPRPEASAEGREAGGTVWQQAFYGWTFIRRRRGLMHLLFLAAGLNFSLGAVQMLITPLVLGFASPMVLGTVLSIAASGMLVGSLVMSLWGGPRRRVDLILAVLLAQGILLLFGGLRPSAALVTVAAFFFLLGFPVIMACGQAIWQSKVAPDVQGRVFAIRRMIAGSTLPLALAVAGPLADAFEPLLAAGGPLAASAGALIGVGAGRGIALLFMLFGLNILVMAAVGFKMRSFRRLEDEVPDAAGIPQAAGAEPALPVTSPVPSIRGES